MEISCQYSKQICQFSPEKPTLILIHGAGDSSIFWNPLTEEMKNVVNVLPIDLPGHGKNLAPSCNSIEDYADAVDKLIKENEIPNPVPCGISMGGAVTLQLLLDGKSDIKFGIIINSGAKLKVMPMLFDVLANDFNAYVEFLPVLAVSKKTDKSKIDFLVKEISKTDPNLISNDFKACDSFDVRERLKEIDKDILILSAEEDQLTPPDRVSFLSDNIKKS